MERPKRNINEDFKTKISKTMAFLLRHGAQKEGLNIRNDGYVLVEEFLNHPKLKSWKIDLDLLKTIVDTNDKKRYELAKITDPNSGITELFIRAVQGHTIKTIEDDKLLKKIEDPNMFAFAVHGTYLKSWDLIRSQGLKPMSRNHIHFAPGYPGSNEVISGMRKSCDLYIEVDIKKAMKEGMEFYLSTNSVILTSGINGVLEPKFFKKVIDKTGKCIFEGENIIIEEKKVDKKESFDVIDKFEEKKMDIEDNPNKKTAQLESDELDFILVLDFEAQCINGSKLPVQEIVEFPVVPINLKTLSIEEPLFHYYIKPVVVPELTELCKSLTGITQEQVNNGVILETALELFHKYLESSGLNKKKWVFCTCGEWDLNTCIKQEAQKKKIVLPGYFKNWINVKKIFQEINKTANLMGMDGMLKFLGLNLDGRHHSGIDDSKNIAKIVIELLRINKKEVLAKKWIHSY